VAQDRVAASPGDGGRGRRMERSVEREGKDASKGVERKKERGRGAGPPTPVGIAEISCCHVGERQPEGEERQEKGGGDEEGVLVGVGVEKRVDEKKGEAVEENVLEEEGVTIKGEIALGVPVPEPVGESVLVKLEELLLVRLLKGEKIGEIVKDGMAKEVGEGVGEDD
jgi:hypothetical protein